MKTAAVIAEFNPFHNGHAYLLQKVREYSGADHIASVMSGDFVQRGEPAVFDKYVRTKAALKGGADIVLELPVRYATSNAGGFALGAVSILNGLGCIDELWFGSEAGVIEPFERLSELISEEPDEFRLALKEELKKGKTYPEARSHAIKMMTDSDPATASLLSSSGPNNNLGLEYCVALRKTKSRIIPKTISRTGCGHNDTVPSGSFLSASAIREMLLKGPEGIEAAAAFIPDPALKLYRDCYKKGALPEADDLSLLLKYRIMSCSCDELCGYQDVSADLARRIKQNENSFCSFTRFADLIKTRNLTRTHVNRALLHIILGLKKDGQSPLSPSPAFARLLGFRNKSKPFFSAVKESGNISLCSRAVDMKDAFFEEDVFASNLYESVAALKSGSPFINEYERKLIRME